MDTVGFKSSVSLRYGQSHIAVNKSKHTAMMALLVGIAMYAAIMVVCLLSIIFHDTCSRFCHNLLPSANTGLGTMVSNLEI